MSETVVVEKVKGKPGRKPRDPNAPAPETVGELVARAKGFKLKPITAKAEAIEALLPNLGAAKETYNKLNNEVSELVKKLTIVCDSLMSV